MVMLFLVILVVVVLVVEKLLLRNVEVLRRCRRVETCQLCWFFYLPYQHLGGNYTATSSSSSAAAFFFLIFAAEAKRGGTFEALVTVIIFVVL